MELDTFDLVSLEWFLSDLIAAGFEPVPRTDRRLWRGPIHPAFDGLTDARTMDIALHDGWPYVPPSVLVQGLNTNHYTLDGFVCLWREGDPSREWETVNGLFGRIEGWCENAKNGWQDDDLPFDAYLNFKNKWALLATFDFESLHTSVGGWGDLAGVISENQKLMNLRARPVSSPRELPGLWFRVGELRASPPRNLAELPQHLNRSQKRGLERALSQRRSTSGPQTRGAVDVILFAWERQVRTDLLIMACEGTGDDVDAAALVAEPNDGRSLRLRAGPDAEVLKGRKVVLFGAGALGGHVAVILASSGIESLRVVDRDVLSPGNVVRHVVGHDQVGGPKVSGVQAVIENHAHWSEVDPVIPSVNPSGPKEIAELIEDADLVIDATGNDAFVSPIAQVAVGLGKALISGALYRGGFIGRVRRKALDTDAPIDDRPDSRDYPVIPIGDPGVDHAEPSLGCSAPVNNAPPASVLACASLIALAAIDVLTQRFDFEDETIDVYRKLPEAPFDVVGRYRRTVLPSM